MYRALGLSILLLGELSLPVAAQSRQAPPGMFKELNDDILGDAILIYGKQLFIDDYIIDELQGVEKRLQQPVKHPQNPLVRRDRPWEEKLSSPFGYGAVVRDDRDGQYKIWYQIWHDEKDAVGSLGYVSSSDGIVWEKPVVDSSAGNNWVVFEPEEPWVAGAGILIDSAEPDPARRFKMTYLAKPDGKNSSLQSGIAFSADGLHWNPDSRNPVMPYSDTQIAPYWDSRLQRFVAYLRFGPPNVRIISRVESEDFLHWSNKVTVVNKSRLDEPFATELYTMNAMPYAGVYVGLLNTYHGETIQPIPADKPWMDRVDNQLVFSRNGVTWQRVLKDGAVSAARLRDERDWKAAAEQATFLPYGEFRQDWDWGQVYPHHPPLVVGDEIRFYYTGISGRHWHTYHQDTRDSGIGLATLRLDGFISVQTETEGTLTTRPLVFFGDTLEFNADASNGSIRVEALDAEGKPLPGFGKEDCDAVTTDSVRHAASWNGDADCQLLQGRPIRLRFHLQSARLYAFEPRIRANHYLQSYD